MDSERTPFKAQLSIGSLSACIERMPDTLGLYELIVRNEQGERVPITVAESVEMADAFAKCAEMVHVYRRTMSCAPVLCDGVSTKEASE